LEKRVGDYRTTTGVDIMGPRKGNKLDTVVSHPAFSPEQEKNGDDENLLPRTTLMGVVVKVENLDVARAFYRDVLDLGAPVMDSNFWVEFKIGDSASLVLEQARPGEKLVPTKGRVAWICETNDLDEIVARLLEMGHEPVTGETDKIGFKVLKYQDPEGNPFYIKPAKC